MALLHGEAGVRKFGFPVSPHYAGAITVAHSVAPHRGASRRLWERAPDQVWGRLCARNAFASSFAGRPAPTEALARTGVQHSCYRGASRRLWERAPDQAWGRLCARSSFASSFAGRPAPTEALARTGVQHSCYRGASRRLWERAPDQVWGRLCARSFFASSFAGRPAPTEALARTGVQHSCYRGASRRLWERALRAKLSNDCSPAGRPLSTARIGASEQHSCSCR
jgi:D-alanyl-D-alanine dipeptidase